MPEARYIFMDKLLRLKSKVQNMRTYFLDSQIRTNVLNNLRPRINGFNSASHSF